MIPMVPSGKYPSDGWVLSCPGKHSLDGAALFNGSRCAIMKVSSQLAVRASPLASEGPLGSARFNFALRARQTVIVSVCPSVCVQLRC